MCKLHVIFEQIEFATILQSHDSESLIHMVQQYRLYQPHTSDTKMLQCSRAHPKLLSWMYKDIPVCPIWTFDHSVNRQRYR